MSPCTDCFEVTVSPVDTGEKADHQASAFTRSHNDVVSISSGSRSYRQIISPQERRFPDEPSVPLLSTLATQNRPNNEWRQTLNPGPLMWRTRCQHLMRPRPTSIQQHSTIGQCLPA